jgi:putative PEP-CTERM system histidine kinase
MVSLPLKVSFLSCALAYAALAVLLRPGLGGGAPRTRLRIACITTCAWALGALWYAGQDLPREGFGLLSSILLLSVWLWQLEPVARWQNHPRWFLLILRWLGVSISAIAILAMGLPADHPVVALVGRWLPMGGVVLAAAGLFALEQTYRNASLAAAAAIRWFCLGIGGLFVVELVGLAQVMLVGQTPMGLWTVRGALYALCAVAIAHGALRMPNWSFGLSISRHVVFYTTSFTAIGTFLVLLSSLGWLLLQSHEWTAAVQVGFAVLGGLTLAALLFSGTLLRRWRVFISTHFYAQRYDYRREWLRFIRTLSESCGATVAARCIRAVSQIVESPRAVLWRRNDLGTSFELGDSHGFEQPPAPMNVAATDALPAYLERTGWLIDLVELRKTPAQYDGLSLEPQRYGAPADGLIVPLMHMEHLYGWLVLDRPQDMIRVSVEDRDLLKTAGRQIAAYLAQHDADLRLAAAGQFETYNRMTAFMMHDLKNLAAQLQLVSQNAIHHKHNPQFVDDAMETVAASAARMTRLINQLKGAPESGTMNTADLADVVQRTVKRCASREPVPRLVTNARPTIFADVERLGSVIEHAIRNAQEATPPGGDVCIEVDEVDAHPVVRIRDNGCGMDQAFVRDRLFRPFDTTKGTRGMGIGAFQLREYIRSLGGSVEVQSAPGKGSCFTLSFPADVQRQLAGNVQQQLARNIG